MMLKTSTLTSFVALSLALWSSSLYNVRADELSEYAEKVFAEWDDTTLASAKESFLLIDTEEEKTYTVEASGPHGLYKLVEATIGEGDDRRRELDQRPLTTGRALKELALVSPNDGAKFTDPRTIKFKATVKESLTDLHFVFDDLTTNEDIPITVEADEINNALAVEHVGGFNNGMWAWHIEGRDADGNLVKTEQRQFQVDGVVELALDANNRRLQEAAQVVGLSNWTAGTDGGRIQAITGRIYYKDNNTHKACSGAAVKDYKSGRSLVVTAAHCIYNVSFANSVIFIPNRDARTTSVTGLATARSCTSDPCGCWVASASIVPAQWPALKWPYSATVDYGMYIFDDQGSHTGNQCGSTALDVAVNAMDLVTDQPVVGQYMHALGYPGTLGKDLLYCANTAKLEKPYFAPVNGTWFVDQCDLKPGSSGGPWVAHLDNKTHSTTGFGVVVGVNSWGYTSVKGMGAAIIGEKYMTCMINRAREIDLVAMRSKPIGAQGEVVDDSCSITRGDIDPKILITPSVGTFGDPHFRVSKILATGSFVWFSSLLCTAVTNTSVTFVILFCSPPARHGLATSLIIMENVISS
jgi:hypothetical protein